MRVSNRTVPQCMSLLFWCESWLGCCTPDTFRGGEQREALASTFPESSRILLQFGDRFSRLLTRSSCWASTSSSSWALTDGMSDLKKLKAIADYLWLFFQEGNFRKLLCNLVQYETWWRGVVEIPSNFEIDARICEVMKTTVKSFHDGLQQKDHDFLNVSPRIFHCDISPRLHGLWRQHRRRLEDS